MQRMVLQVTTVIVAVLALASFATADVPQMINYQGRLTDTAGYPLDTTVSMVFTIYDDSAAGVSKWSEPHGSVDVTTGLFNVILGGTVPIDDSVFNGPNRFLGITVGLAPELSPRTRLISVGYSHRVSTVDGATGGTISGDVSIQSDLSISGKATIGPGHTNTGSNAFIAGQNNTAGGAFSSVSGGQFNEAGGAGASIGGGSANIASGPEATVAGGENNEASGIYAVIGGGTFNRARGRNSVVSGGGGVALADSNAAWGDYSAVGGGSKNVAINEHATIGGGLMNSASGKAAAISGGYQSNASGDYSFVGGGAHNSATNDQAVVAGGESNRVEGNFSAILGGFADTITSTANYSYLFGIDSKLTEDSTFMVDMPHIRFGDETDGYEFPTSDGNADQVMATDGNGQLNWIDVTSGTGGWTDDGTVVRLTTGSDAVGIGTSTPSGKLDVIGDANVIDGTLFLKKPSGQSNIIFKTSTGVSAGFIKAEESTELVTYQANDRAHNFVSGSAPTCAFFDDEIDVNGIIRSTSGGFKFPDGTVQTTAVTDHGQLLGLLDDDHPQYLLKTGGTMTGTLTLQRPSGQSNIVFKTSTGTTKGYIKADESADLLTYRTNNGVHDFESGSSPTCAFFDADIEVTGDICYTGSIGPCSDARFKENVETLTGTLEKVLKLRGVSFQWRREEFPDKKFGEGDQIGFIAQEIVEVIPEVVQKARDGYYYVDYSRLTPMLVEAVKEQQRTISDLRVQLSDLQVLVRTLLAQQDGSSESEAEYTLSK